MANVFSNIRSDKKEEKKTKTKQSNLSSKITINKNTNSKSIQENLNKSSVTNPLSNSTQGSKVKVVNTKLSADTKASKADKAKVSSNKATVTNPLETSYQPSTKNTQKVTSNNEAKSKKNVFDGYFSGENLANSNAEFGSSTSANIGKQVVNNIIEGQREAKQFIDTVGKLISIGSKARMNTVVTNDKGEQKSMAAPIQTGTQKVANVLDKADNWINTEASKINQRHLDAKFSTYIDEDSVYEKIKNDDTYASKLVNSDGGLIDYSDQIAALEEKVKTSSKTDADVELLNELKEIRDDQSKIVYASFYKQLEENGATEEELNEFKNAVIIGDYNLVQRAVTNFGGTVEGYIGGTVKGYDTIFAKISELLGVDYEQAEYVDKVIDHAEDLQALTRQNASSGMEKFVYDVYDGMSSFLYATMTTTAAHYLKGGNPLNTLSKAEYDAIIGTPSLLLSDVSVLGTKMKENVEAGYDFDTSFNNAFWHAVKSHMTESIGGESLANIVTGEISEETLEHTMTYMIKSMSNQFLSEFAEEGMEAAVEPIIDAKTLNTGLTVEGYIKQVFNGDTAYQMLVGGMGGLVMGSIASTSNVISYNKQINEYVDSIKIETKKDYNVANDVISDLENIVADAQTRIRQKEANGEDVTLDKNQTIISNQIIKAYKKKVNDYASTHPYLNSYASEEDTSNIDLSDARETILDAAKPDMASAMDEIVEAKRVIEEQSQKAVDALQEKLNKDNVNISATEFVNMSEEAKEQVLLVNKYAQATNKNVSFANLVGKDGSIIDGLHDSSTGQIIINPNAKRGALSTLVHEFTHGVESSRYYGELEKLTREYYGDDISNNIQYIKDNYSSIQILSDQDAMKELVAITTQDLLGNQDYVDRLVMYNNSLAFRLYEDIKSLNESTGTVGDIETTFMRAFENCKSQINDQSFQFSKYVDADSVIKAAKEEFGTTSSYIKAGYILPDGDYLDLSEGQNRRTQDHREVGYLFDIDYAKEGMSAGMIQFMNLGNIRIHPESCGIDISNATNPTYEQYQTIRSYLKNFSGDEIYLDVSDENGRNVFSIAYKEGTSTNRVLEDIKQYFENGIIPENNHDDYFDYSKGISLTDKQNYSDATASNDIDKAQTIVDKLAKVNGYNVEAWHGTNNYGFTVFKTDIENNESSIGSHFGTQKAAEGFAYDEYAHGNGERGVYHVYLKALNPYETYDMFAQENCYIAAETLSLANNLDTLEAQEIKQYIGDKYHLVNIDEDMDEAWRYGESEKAIGDDGVEKGLNYILDKKLYQYFADMVKANGYDSITYENTLEDDGNVDYVILDPQSIKSADAITYDNEGKVISLEERFNVQNEDIRYSNGVKLSDSKNDKGEFLTNDQEEYFKESKLRDAEGNLKVVYHGTNSNFDTFNRAYARSSGLYGNGFYFGYGENTSNLYGNSKPYYLNLTNPLYANGEKTFNISNEQKKAFIEAVANNEDYTLNNYGVDATVDSVYNLTKDHDDFAFINDLNLTCIGNMVEATELFNEVNGTNYDGIIVDDQVVAFYPNQIKSIENLHPTANNNFNLSKGLSLADIQNYEHAAEQNDEETAQAIVDSVAAKNGYDTSEKVYHGTNYDSINIFTGNPYVVEENGRTRIKGYFSNLRDYSEQYGDNVHSYYLKNGKYLYLVGAYSLDDMREQLAANGVTDVRFNDAIDGEGFNNWLESMGYEVGEDFVDPWAFFNEGNGGNITERIQAAGYDGIAWLEGTDETGREGYAYMPFKSEDIKSAEPFTYDDNGDLIPLEARFNDYSNDIRYSFQDDLNKIKERNEIDAANEMLGIDDAYWESLYETADQLEGNATKEVKLDDVKNGNTHVREDMKTKRPTHTIKEDANRIIKNFVNKSKYIWDLSRNTKNENIYPLYNQYMNSRSVADRMLYKKGGWADIINEIPKDMQNDFSYMVYHGVNIDAAKYNKNVFKDYTSEQSAQIVSQYLLEHPEWQSTWNKVLDYENMLKQKLVDSGRISQATADKWGEMYPHYVHVVRIMDDTDVKETADPKVKSSNSGTVKERKGGRQDIKSLNDAITEQTYQVARGTSLNDFAKEYAKISHAKVSNEFANIMNFQQTIDSLADVGDVLKAADENTPAQLVYYDDGDLMVMDIPNELYEVFENNNKLPNNKITQGLNKVNDFRRNLITGWNLTFSVRNIIKDTQDMFYKSNHPLATFVNLPKAMVGLAMSEKSSNSKLYQLAEDWRDLGGGSGNYTQLHEGSTFFNNTIGRIERLNNYIESVPRFAEFMASLEKGRTPTQAMYDSDKVTTNFKMGGEYTKWLDRNGFTFLNASVEGFNEIIQSYESAYDNKGWKGVVGKMAISTLVLNVPLMILNHLLWKDDDDYQDLSDYVKDNYYIIFKMKDGKFFRIPKGRIAAAYQGVLNSIYDSGVELVSDDSATEKAKTLWENSLDAIKNTWDNIGVNNPFTNNILAPIFQVANNETWYGEAIESESDLKKAPAQRYDYSTDTFSRWVGENLNLSPKKINYLLDQYSGGIGDVVLPMLTPKAESGLDDGTLGGKIVSALLSPAVNDFTTDPVFKNQNVSDLFTLSEELTQQANREDATDDQKIANKYITTIKNQMFELYGERADIFNDSSLSDSEKYRQARVVQQQIDELAKTGINTYDQLDIQGNYASVNGYGYYKDGDDWKMVDTETMDEMNSLNMNMAQRETFYNLKEEITSNNKVKTLLGYYEQKENLKESTYSDSIKAAKLEELDKKIANAEKKFTETELAQIKQKGTIDSKTLNYESIKNSNLTDEQKNYVYDQYYDSTVGTYINDLDISDADKFELKYAVSTATGVKDSKGNTISNTKALAVANAYASLGVLDEVYEYINNYGLSPSEMGLSKTLMGWSYTTMASKYKQYFGQEFGSRTSDASNVISSPESYDGGSSGGSSGSSGKGSSSTAKQLKAMKAYMSALTSNNNIFSALDNMTTIEDAKKNVEDILKDAYKG